MIRWPLMGRRERLRRQAAAWIARLNGPHDARDREAFEQWYRTSPAHAEAYDRLATLFALAGAIRHAPRGGISEPADGRFFRARTVRYGLAGLAAAAGIAVLAVVVLGAGAPAPDGAVQSAIFASAAGQSRRIVLAEGSVVVLAPGSELDVKIDGRERRLLLKRGEGRFTVSHDARPFVVSAAGTRVVARGTQFVVRLGEEETLVALIEGRIDVSYPPPLQGGARRMARLTPGQRLVAPAEPAPPPASPDLSPNADRREMIVFDDTPLADAVERINRHAALPVRLAGPGLAELRVTGAYRAGDAEGFARAIAAALELEVRRGPDGRPWLRLPAKVTAER